MNNPLKQQAIDFIRSRERSTRVEIREELGVSWHQLAAIVKELKAEGAVYVQDGYGYFADYDTFQFFLKKKRAFRDEKTRNRYATQGKKISIGKAAAKHDDCIVWVKKHNPALIAECLANSRLVEINRMMRGAA